MSPTINTGKPKLACEISADRVLAGRVIDNGGGLEACAAREEACRNDAAVVEDEQVIGPQEIGEVVEVAVGEGPGDAVDGHHAGVAALGGWVLRDERGGQVEVEVGNAHVFYESSKSASQQGTSCGSRLWRSSDAGFRVSERHVLRT